MGEKVPSIGKDMFDNVFIVLSVSPEEWNQYFTKKLLANKPQFKNIQSRNSKIVNPLQLTTEKVIEACNKNG